MKEREAKIEREKIYTERERKTTEIDRERDILSKRTRYTERERWVYNGEIFNLVFVFHEF